MITSLGDPAAVSQSGPPDLAVLWGKLGRGGAAPGYHPLICHLLEVAAVAAALWAGVVPGSRRAGVAAALQLDENFAGRWVAGWAGLHDLGKASPPFQGQDPLARARVAAAGYRVPPPRPGRPIPHGVVTAATLADALGPLAPPTTVVERVAVAIGGHHGVFPRSIDLHEAERAVGTGRWAEARRDLAARLVAVVASNAPPAALDPATAIWLAGFVSVADWIGSNGVYFPLAVPDPAAPPIVPLDDYERVAAGHAARALHDLGWSTWRASPGVRSFAGLFPDLPAPNPMQAAVADLAAGPDAPRLVVIEAPMGEGKTEAALYLTDRWGTASGHAGAYVALPTRATSDQMFGRVRDFLARRYPAEIVNAQLLHANAGVDAVFFHLPVIYDVEQALGDVRNAVAAAKTAGVRLVVFEGNPQIPDRPTAVPASEIERGAEAYLFESGLPTVVLRPTMYMDSLAGPWTAPGIVADGVLAYPLPADTEAAWLAAEDAAALAIAALKRPELAGRSFDIGGPEILDGAAVVARFADALGRLVRYQAIPLDDFERGLNAALGAPTGTEIAKQYRWYEDQGRTRRVTADMAPVLAELPVRLTPFAEWIRARDWAVLAGG